MHWGREDGRERAGGGQNNWLCFTETFPAASFLIFPGSALYHYSHEQLFRSGESSGPKAREGRRTRRERGGGDCGEEAA